MKKGALMGMLFTDITCWWTNRHTIRILAYDYQVHGGQGAFQAWWSALAGWNLPKGV